MNYTVTQIIDKTTQLELLIDATNYVTIPKSAIKLKLEGNIVYLYDSSQSAITNLAGEQQVYQLLFASITAPATLSANALVLAILTMLNTGTVSGDATAANQILEIAALNSILAKIIAAPATAALQTSSNTALSSILGQLDITQTALANLIKGGSTLNDVVAWLQGIYSGVNALSTRVIGSNTTTFTFSDPVIATLVATINTSVQGSGLHRIGSDSFVWTGLTWVGFVTLSTG